MGPVVRPRRGLRGSRNSGYPRAALTPSARKQAAQDRADGIGVYAATSPQPVRAVRPEPGEDELDWHLVRPADMDEYTDQPARTGFRRT